jgi:hypothetical protein
MIGSGENLFPSRTAFRKAAGNTNQGTGLIVQETPERLIQAAGSGEEP